MSDDEEPTPAGDTGGLAMDEFLLALNAILGDGERRDDVAGAVTKHPDQLAAVLVELTGPIPDHVSLFLDGTKPLHGALIALLADFGDGGIDTAAVETTGDGSAPEIAIARPDGQHVVLTVRQLGVG